MSKSPTLGTSALVGRGWAVPAYEVREFAARASRYVVLIPVLNEGARIQNQLRRMHELGIPRCVDIVVVDGGSIDGSLAPEFLAQLQVRAILTKTGPGRLSAQLRCGYAWALLEGYEGIITIDGNGKDGVETVPDFIAALDAGYSYIQASRFIVGGHSENTPISRYLAIRLLHAPLLSLAAGQWLTDTTQGYRAYSAAYLIDPQVQPFRDIFERYELLAYLTVRASQLGYRVKELPTSRVYPADEAIPTKINGIKALVDLLLVVFKTLFGAYNPRRG